MSAQLLNHVLADATTLHALDKTHHWVVAVHHVGTSATHDARQASAG